MTKRLFDLVLVIGCAPLWVPALIVVAVVVRISIGAPVLFTQQRAGLRGRPFNVYKFRSMTNETDSNGELLSDELRLTRAGRLLRATSLDEIPQLLNVLRGDISLVGPRPLHVRYIDRYSAEQARRLESVPGITGWAQVNGRNTLSWDRKFELDVWYVDHQSFFLDLKILFLTVWVVFRRSGVNQSERGTMEEFMGPSSDHSE